MSDDILCLQCLEIYTRSISLYQDDVLASRAEVDRLKTYESICNAYYSLPHNVLLPWEQTSEHVYHRKNTYGVVRLVITEFDYDPDPCVEDGQVEKFFLAKTIGILPFLETRCTSLLEAANILDRFVKKLSYILIEAYPPKE